MVVDPRPVISYLEGHLRNAVNLPIANLFDQTTLRLLPEDRLVSALSGAGVDSEKTLLLYDEYDGQSAAMLAWVLEYLGHNSVNILSSFLETWIKDGKEVMYRPVIPKAGRFEARVNPGMRASLSDVKDSTELRLLDARTKEEFHGIDEAEMRKGHIPNATSLPLSEVVAKEGYLRPKTQLRRIFSRAGLRQGDPIVIYCRIGPRAAVEYSILQAMGYGGIRLYDGSFHEWATHGELPIET